MESFVPIFDNIYRAFTRFEKGVPFKKCRNFPNPDKIPACTYRFFLHFGFLIRNL